MASPIESLFNAIESVLIYYFLDTTFNANIVYSTRFQKFYVSFERATIKNRVPARYSVSFTKYATRRLLAELPGILDKLEQYELRQAQEQHNASASASAATPLDLLEPNKEQQAARGGESGGGGGLLRLGGVCAPGQAAGGGDEPEPARYERAGDAANAGGEQGARGECSSSGRQKESASVAGADPKEAKLTLTGTQANAAGGRKRYRLEEDGVTNGN